MKTTKKSIITVQTIINAPVEKVWNLWTDPIHIVRWNNASEDWFTPGAENDLRVGGSFLSRMEAKDGSSGFDFKGNYSKVVQDEQIEYTMDDGIGQITLRPYQAKITNNFKTNRFNVVLAARQSGKTIPAFHGDF